MHTKLMSADPAAACRLVLSDDTVLSEEIVTLTYSAGCSSSTTGPSLGSTVSANCTVKLAGSLPILEGQAVTLEVQTGPDTWTPLGQFRFQTPEVGEETTTVTAVDAMLAVLEAGYFPPSPEPTTALGVLRDVCEQSGLVLGDVSGLTDVPISGSLTGYTCREMVGYMAALLGRNAVMNPWGALELIWYAPSGVTIGPDDYYSGGFTRKDYDWTLEQITASTGDQENNTFTVGDSGCGISFANPYVTQNVLDGIWTELQGFCYRPGEVTLLGRLGIAAGDLFTVTDRTGGSYTLAVMAVEHSYDGGWKTKLTAYGVAETDTSAGYKGPTTTALERLTAQLVSTNKLVAQKADIDLLNVKQAVIQDLLVRGGIVTGDLNAVEISASKYLTGVTIIGDVIQANTLTADKLLLRGEDGLIYELNAQAGSLTAQQLEEEQYKNALDGSVLAASSITADKINVTDLFAQDITATGTITGAKLVGGTLEAAELIGGTGSFAGEITAERGQIGGFVIDGGSLYGNDVYKTSAGTEELVTFWLHGVPSTSETGVGSPNLTYVGAWDGTPRAMQASLRVDLKNAPSGGGASSFDRLLLRVTNASTGRSGELAVTASGVEISGSQTVTGNLAAAGSLSTYGVTVPRIQHGRVPQQLTANTDTNVTITFPRAFPGVPSVTITPQHDSAVSSFTYKLRSVSASGCVVYLRSSTGGNHVIHWQAMY